MPEVGATKRETKMTPRASEGPKCTPGIPAFLPAPHSLSQSCGSGFGQEGETSWSNVKGPGELGEGNTLEVSLRLEGHLFPGLGQHEGGPSPASIHHQLTGCLPNSLPTPAPSRASSQHPCPSELQTKGSPSPGPLWAGARKREGKRKTSETQEHWVSGEHGKIMLQSGDKRVSV